MEEKDLVIAPESPVIEIIDDKPDNTTTTDVIAPASTVNESNADEKTTVEKEEGDKPEAKAKEIDPALEERQKNAQIVKMGKLEKERNELAKERETERQARLQDTLELLKNPGTSTIASQRLARDPKFYDDFRNYVRQTEGENIGDYNTYFSNTPQANTQTRGNYVDPEAIKSQVKQELRTEQIQTEAFTYLINNIPEIDPRKNDLSETEAEYIKNQLDTAGFIAQRVQSFNPNMSYKEALVEGWNSLPENRNKQLAQAKEAGELIGKSKALASGVGGTTATSGSGGSAIKSNTYRMTSSEKKMYENLLTMDPKRAEKYAQKATEYNS